jgi:hypothetical protein
MTFRSQVRKLNALALLATIFLFAISESILADNNEILRSIQFEWEAVEDATLYEIEVTDQLADHKTEGPPRHRIFSFQTKIRLSSQMSASNA